MEGRMTSRITTGESGGVPTGGLPGDSGFGFPQGLQLGGRIAQGLMARRNLNNQADVARENAQLSRARAQVEARREQRASRLRMGRIRAQAGASGISLESFGPVMEDQAREEELNRLLILFGGDAEARRDEAQSRALRREGQTRLLGSIIEGTTTTLPRLLT